MSQLNKVLVIAVVFSRLLPPMIGAPIIGKPFESPEFIPPPATENPPSMQGVTPSTAVPYVESKKTQEPELISYGASGLVQPTVASNADAPDTSSPSLPSITVDDSAFEHFSLKTQVQRKYYLTR